MKPIKRDKWMVDWLRRTFTPGIPLMIEPSDAISQMTIAIHLELIEFVPSSDYRPFHYQLTPTGEIYINDSIPLARNEAQDTPPVGLPVADDFVITQREVRAALDEVDNARMADENRRLRAFVRKLADFAPLENTFASQQWLPTSWITEARALLDTEAAPDVPSPDDMPDYAPCTVLADPLRAYYATHNTNEFIKPGRAMGTPAGDKVQIIQNGSIGTIPADCVVWETAPDVPQPTEHAEIRLWDNSEQSGEPLFVGTLSEAQAKARELRATGQTVFLDDPAWPYMEKHYPFRAATDMPTPDTGGDNL